MWPCTAKEIEKDTQTKGLTSAISTAYPKPAEIERTTELIDSLLQLDVNETEEELSHRMEVLSRLNNMIKEWIVEMSLARNMPQNVADQVGGKIYTFGSYRLGVHQKGADIDALCVAPRHIDRQDYFTSFYEKLKQCPDVNELRAIEDAFVPVLKMNFDGIEIDLLFARLALKEIPDTMDLRDDMLLKNLDPKCVRSLNGCRVTDEILRLVPNINTFKLALRAIKLWAKEHGIYSNVLGYLGGVSWAMLVARTCQLYPNAAAAVIVHKFFLVFAQWEWPNPVLLKSISNPTNLSFPIWDPKSNIADRAHLMPIITPAYPQQNSTFNVSYSTRTIIEHELRLGFQIVEDILIGRSKWPLLFEKPNFFSRYKHFIVLIASTSTKEEHLEWYGLVESKIRHLVGILERNLLIQVVHVNPEIFKHKDSGKPVPVESDGGKDEQYDEHYVEIGDRPNTLWFVGLEFIKAEQLNLNLTQEIQNFINAVLRHATGIGMYKETMRIEAKYVKRKHLKRYVPVSVIKRDRSLSDIFEPLLEDGAENSATILLRRSTSESIMSLLPNVKNSSSGPLKRRPDSTSADATNKTGPQIKLRRKSDNQQNNTSGKVNDGAPSVTNDITDVDLDNESCVSSISSSCSTSSSTSSNLTNGTSNDDNNNKKCINKDNGDKDKEIDNDDNVEQENKIEDCDEDESVNHVRRHRRHRHHKRHRHHHRRRTSGDRNSRKKHSPEISEPVGLRKDEEEKAIEEDTTAEEGTLLDEEEREDIIDLGHSDENIVATVILDDSNGEEDIKLSEDSISNNDDISFIDLTDESDDSDVTFVSATSPRMVPRYRY